MKIEDFILKIKRKWAKIRLEPIRVLCFHQVSDAFDESTMYKDDWIATKDFKEFIENMRRQGYMFISLVDAHAHIKHDLFRTRKYAVITADDGWASLKNILPWLNEQHIPITLFINPAYLDGKHFRERDTEKYLTEEEVQNLHRQYPLLTIGSHGWEHVPATQQSNSEFIESVNKSVMYLHSLPNYIPYFAYPWGWNTRNSHAILHQMGLTPVKVNGRNINDATLIQREKMP